MMEIKALLEALPFRTWQGEEQFESEACYPAYVELGRELRPRSILEIGAFEGYGLAAFWMGAGIGVNRLDWVDNERYGTDSNAHCRANLEAVANLLGWPMPGMLGVDNKSKLRWPGVYDLIHVDGDHSYSGALLDMVWAWGRWPRVLLVDDYDFLPEVRRAVETFAELSGLVFEHRASLRGWAMFRTAVTDRLGATNGKGTAVTDRLGAINGMGTVVTDRLRAINGMGTAVADRLGV